MSTASHGKIMGGDEGIIDDTSLILAAANDLASPLILLRQIGLMLESDSLDDAKRQQLTQRLTLTSERALRMAASLSMTSGQQREFALEPINPVSVCKDVIYELTPLYAAHGQRIEMPRRTRVPLLVGNRHLLHHVLLAYVDNALNYGSTTNPIQMSISGYHDKVRIGVRDFGPALPIDLWQRLENRVTEYRQTAIVNRPHASTISLIAAKKLAEAMGSAVGIIRHRNGTTFYVDLNVSGQMSLL